MENAKLFQKLSVGGKVLSPHTQKMHEIKRPHGFNSKPPINCNN
jgi:hypothetical protein